MACLFGQLKSMYILLTAFDAISATLDIFCVGSLNKPSASLHGKRPFGACGTLLTTPMKKQRPDGDIIGGKGSFIVPESFVNQVKHGWLIKEG